jgi:pimeloyl-ACP methyl ester carboxylesterase
MRTPGFNLECKVDDSVLCYDDVGEGSVPLIFIHGFPFDKSMWKPQVEFAATFTRVIAYDIRGFGKSQNGSREFSINLFADDLIQLMDLLEIPKAIICGLSMGGYIALNAVDRYKERFAAMILADTQCVADTAEGKEKRYRTIELIESKGLGVFAESFVKNIFCDETLQHKKEIVERIQQVILNTAPSTVTATLKALASRWETCSTLSEISVPVLIVCGTEDKVTPYAQSEKLRSSIKNSTIKPVQNAGHMSNLEQVEEFNGYLRDFLEINKLMVR